MSSSIPSAPAYGVYASQLIRYARCCSNSPPTTLHGRFENAFPVWRENFPRSFKFDIEVDPRVPTFGGNLGYFDKLFCGWDGETVWQRNTQDLTGKQ